MNNTHGPVPLRYLQQKAVLPQLLAGLALVGAVGGAILYGGEFAIQAYLIVTLTVAAGLMAYHFPTATVVAWAVVNLYGQHLLRSFNLPAGVDARPTDPLLLGMSVALAFSLIVDRGRLRRTLLGPLLAWTLFALWIAFQILRSAPSFGLVSTLGEFRWTFQAILIVPYVVVFVRTREAQMRVVKMLALLSVIIVGAAFINGASILASSSPKGNRWMVAQANLALVYCILAWFVARRTGLWTKATPAFTALTILTVALVVICAHRSVWMASAAAALALVLFGAIPLRVAVAAAITLVTAGITLDVLLEDLDIIAFLQERTTAFTSFQEDPTARWRFEIWTAALEQAKQHPFMGKGLGNYFYIPLSGGRVADTILHNAYVQIALQTGLIGITLYVALLATFFRRLWKAYRTTLDEHTFAMAIIGMTALFGGAVFYVAYSLDPYTWIVASLGIAAVTQADEKASVAPMSAIRRRALSRT